MSFLFPDIDHPKSTIGKRVKFISFPISKFFGHRDFTHSLLAVSIVYFFTSIFEKCLYKSIFYGIYIGYLGHILADFFTPFGVPIFWPFRIYFSIPILRSKNEKKESYFGIFLSIILIVFEKYIFYAIKLVIQKINVLFK
ncbi:metal-dependent hydrolase [bacterium endosymbiont of Pedicinus badii]|uniref:metal-dependent hydrolase n=1 Tax=bacterium endosymbiont of Pedicinus badii TaxID=1719126 RepID=UPI003CC9C304